MLAINAAFRHDSGQVGAMTIATAIRPSSRLYINFRALEYAYSVDWPHFMKINKAGSDKSVSRPGAKKPTRTEGPGFMDALKKAAQTPETSEVTETKMAQPIEGILSVQAVSDESEQQSRRQAQQYGLDLLDHLDKIREGLLAGAIPKDRLMALAQSMRQKRRKVDDPYLNQIIDEIELRAEVEIAKLTRGK